MRFITIVSALLLSLGAAVAQDYPSRPITVLVPYAAGGPTDTIARLTAASMAKSLGQQIIVENATGAGGTIGTTRAARAQPDGYTLLVHHVGISTAATLYRNLSYDTKTAFAPIGLVTNAPMTIIARPDFPADTLKELVAYAQQQGDKLTYANAGLGAASHLCGMLFMTAIQKQLTTVPYKGNGPIMNDLLGKQIDLTCDQATNTTGPITAKQVKAYAVTTKERLKSLPDLPTADEAGLKGFELGVWHGLYAPKGTPPAVVQKLTAVLQAALRDPALIARFNDINTEPVPQDKATPEALGAMLPAKSTAGRRSSRQRGSMPIEQRANCSAACMQVIYYPYCAWGCFSDFESQPAASSNCVLASSHCSSARASASAALARAFDSCAACLGSRVKMSGRASAVSILVMISLTRAISLSASAMRFFSEPRLSDLGRCGFSLAALRSRGAGSPLRADSTRRRYSSRSPS